MGATEPYGQQFASFANKSFSWRAIEAPAFHELLTHAFGWRHSHKRERYAQISPRVLDLGCGTGRIVDLLHTYTRSELITGIDISRELIEYSTPRFSASDGLPRFIVDDIRNLSQYDWIGEAATAHMFFHMLSKRTLFILLQRLHERLTDNGVIIFGIPHMLRLNKRDFENRSAILVPTPWGTTEVSHPRSTDDYARLLTRTGFAIERVLEPGVHLGFRHQHEAQSYLGSPPRLFILARKV